MTDEELKQLAVDIDEGKVFGSWMIPEDQRLSVVFLPLALGAAEKLQDQDVWGLYEYINKADRHTKDGLPIFMSCHILSQSDCKHLKSTLEKLQALKKAFLSN